MLKENNMAPPFRSTRPKGPVRSRFDPRKDSIDSIAFALSDTALFWLGVLEKAGTSQRIDGYVARHLVEKKLVLRIPDGKRSKYKITFHGEAVLETARLTRKIKAPNL
jgi:hypothetical protein